LDTAAAGERPTAVVSFGLVGEVVSKRPSTAEVGAEYPRSVKPGPTPADVALA
jgi:hypothetical protein